MDAPKIHDAPETLSGLAAAATRWRLRRQNIYIGGKRGFAEPPREPPCTQIPEGLGLYSGLSALSAHAGL